ncbi:MAG TPA: lysine-sensitive aspartokinase 3 [Candidatus Saccharimonadales bacterium]|nr:lysine-sensitive aspartokinase 3 [Candidatus Saccharimonadales bacterium]
MQVMKFGGTSVRDAAHMARVAEIVAAARARRPLVVVSAMAGTTDALLQAAAEAGRGRLAAAESLFRAQRQQHLAAARGLAAPGELPALERALSAECDQLEALARSVATLRELSPRSQDALVAFGERLSSSLVAAALRARSLPGVRVDAAECVLTDDQFGAAAPDRVGTRSRSRQRLLPLLEQGHIPVTQGFLGATADGVPTTLGRGGSDYSAALLGAALDAEVIEIWTDVDGLMTADPRVVPGARRIPVASFAEAAELAYFGAKVLHPATVLPAVERGIPVEIRNTGKPDCEGTRIVPRAPAAAGPVKSIAFKRGITLVNVTSTRMLLAFGFLRALFEVFDRHRTSVDVVTTSEVSVSMTVDRTEALADIRRDLEGFGQVAVETGQAIVSVVGEALKSRPGVAARVFSALGPLEVRMISQGASEINLTFVLAEAQVEDAVRRLHAEFFPPA